MRSSGEDRCGVFGDEEVAEVRGRVRVGVSVGVFVNLVSPLNSKNK